MDSLGRRILMLSAVLLSLISLQSAQAGAARATPSPHTLQLLTTVCKYDDNFKQCMEFLESFPSLSSASSLKDVATIILDLATKETKKMVNYFTGLLNNKGTPGEFKDALKQCADAFNAAVRDFRPELVGGGKASLHEVSKAFFDDEMLCEEVLANDMVSIDAIWPKLENWQKYYAVSYESLEALG